MRNILSLLSLSLIISSCGVGTYSVSSGKADEGKISFTGNSEKNIVVVIDNAPGKTLKTVKEKDYQKARNMKKTSNYSLTLNAGQHTLQVFEKEKLIFKRTIIISTGEHKIIAL